MQGNFCGGAVAQVAPEHFALCLAVTARGKHAQKFGKTFEIYVVLDYVGAKYLHGQGCAGHARYKLVACYGGVQVAVLCKHLEAEAFHGLAAKIKRPCSVDGLFEKLFIKFLIDKNFLFHGGSI